MFAKSLIVSLALVAAAVQADLDISTPSELKQCEEATFVIAGTSGPVWPFVVDPKDPCGDPLRDLDDVTGVLKWTPDLPVGTTVQVQIENSAGNQGWSGVMTITPGSSSACVPNNPSSATSSPPPSSPPAAAAPSSTKTSPVNVEGGPNSPQNAGSSTGAAPARLVATSGATTVLTVLSALALALAL